MWFANHFIPNVPVVILIDSHDSHLDLETFQLAEKNGIYLYALLKNGTHLVQPADVGLFWPTRKSWYKSVRKYNKRNPNSDINKRNFCSAFKSTWEEVRTPSILVNAFCKSGIYPLNSKQVTGEVLNSSEPSDKEPAGQPMSITKHLLQRKHLMPLTPHCPLVRKQSTAVELRPGKSFTVSASRQSRPTTRTNPPFKKKRVMWYFEKEQQQQQSLAVQHGIS